MIKIITFLTSWLVSRLNRVESWLESRDHSSGTKPKFVDLAPTDKADKTGIYSEAILFATNNAKICNIALTGPYGSGKSSIIQSFLKKYQGRALQISLAAFDSGEGKGGGGDVSRQEIERSILQQMLYGADAKKLPLSRFKRIQSPGFGSIFKSLYIMLGILALLYVFQHREGIIDRTFLVPLELSNWINLGSFVLAATFLWVTLHHLYVASFGLSLKGISLRDVEIRPAFDDQTSILNRHLDELVYFFQSTSYDLVIIEDLDRFNSADIFVTLREINSIVNENASVKRTVRFLYALRDDMFVSTDRTKFFEFIIPVVPIINSSNSIDMVLEQGKRLKLDGRLDPQFLREVSRYLNDLRLIQNIFNEYAIYVENLETNGENLLDANKLLAVLIYKNVYPRDFEKLHRGEGIFANILNRQEEFIRNSETILRAEISDIERAIETAQRQTPLDLRELRQIYAMAFIKSLPENVVKISFASQQTVIALSQLADEDMIDKVFTATQVIIYYANAHRQAFDTSKVQDTVDSQKSYLKRKEEIESKTTDNKSKSLRRINDLRVRIGKLRTTRFNELVRLNAQGSEDFFNDFGDNGELARFLILEGFLDDTYYQYISLFHSGRLSPNDNKFLIKIRAFITPEPSFTVDNPKEVIAAMRGEDFRQSYVLNIKLVDTLLRDKNRYLDQTKKLFETISSDFKSAEDFFDAYYTSGRDIERLLSGLVRAWKGLVPAVIASSSNISHVTQLVSNLPETELRVLVSDFDEFSEFVSENLPEILLHSPELAPERLACLDFEVKDLAAIKEFSEIVSYMFEEGLFELTIANLEYIYHVFLGRDDLELMRDRNFTTIRSTNSELLMSRIRHDFNLYLRDILLELEGNCKEDVPAILAVIHNDTVDQDYLREFLERQTTLLPALEDVPERFHSMLFQLCKIQPTWLNCLAYIEGNEFDAGILSGYLDRAEVREAILERPIPGDSDSQTLRQFLFHANSLSDAAFSEYAHALPRSFNNPPTGLDPAKLRILINAGKITFSTKSLEALSDTRELQVLFVAVNTDTYLADPESYALDEDFLEDILRSEIDHTTKLKVVELMDLEMLNDLPERSALIGSIIVNSDANLSGVDGSISQSLVLNSTPIETQVSLFNKYHSLMTDDEVRHVLDNLPKPFCEIEKGYKSPILKNTSENRNLVDWLKARNFVSSASESGISNESIKLYLFRS